MTFEQAVLESLARIEKEMGIGKSASDILKDSGWGTQAEPVPKPEPKGNITYPADGARVIARIPMYFIYKGDGSPSWFTSAGGDLKATGGQVSLILPELGEQNIYAVVGKTVVDQITVTAEEPGPR